MKPWQRLRAFARRFGADVIPKDSFRKSAPFSMYVGLDWSKGHVFILKSALNNPDAIGGMPHELGHVLACRVRPSAVLSELDFLGWEYLVAKKMRIEKEWRSFMETYITSIGHEWGLQTKREQKREIEWAIKRGVECGNIVDGEPVSVRTFS